MPANLDKPHLWKADIKQSVDMYNDWFMQFAPLAYREQRIRATREVKSVLEKTANLTNIESELLRLHPSVLTTLRMTTAPPIARDRLTGLAGVPSHLVESMEIRKQIPPRIAAEVRDSALVRIGRIIMQLADRELFPWLETGCMPSEEEVHRAASVVADRQCGAATDPIIRNAQEIRQLDVIQRWLEARGYSAFARRQGMTHADMPPGTFARRLDVPGQLEDGKAVAIPIDMVIMPQQSSSGDFPLLIEAKSAGDFTNTNKRRKEEANKIANLRPTIWIWRAFRSFFVRIL